jgi:hypothetical protein
MKISILIVVSFIKWSWRWYLTQNTSLIISNIIFCIIGFKYMFLFVKIILLLLDFSCICCATWKVALI